MTSIASAPRATTREDEIIRRLTSVLTDVALIHESVELSSGQQAEYYIDAKRALLQQPASAWVGELVAKEARRLGATAVGGMTIGADPVACAAIHADPRLKAFFVRKQRKRHGLQRWIEGPLLSKDDRCLVVDDVVTTGGSVVDALARIREERLTVVGVVAVVDRRAGGQAAIGEVVSAPYRSLVTIDDIYPDRPDRD